MHINYVKCNTKILYIFHLLTSSFFGRSVKYRHSVHIRKKLFVHLLKFGVDNAALKCYTASIETDD